LSEDFEPGDMYFVSTELEDLASWSISGYIRLDHLVGHQRWGRRRNARVTAVS